jgi:hypothetical protein
MPMHHCRGVPARKERCGLGACGNGGFGHRNGHGPGCLAVEELRRLLSALYRGAEAAASLRMLWDLSGARVPSSFDVRSLTSFIDRNRPKIPGRTAVVAAQDVAYGVSRVAQVHLEDVPVDLQVFRKREDAVEWLAVRYPTANPPRENPGSG